MNTKKLLSRTYSFYALRPTPYALRPTPYALLSLILYSLFLILFACSSPTSDSTGSLSGTIQLEGQEDHYGITVAVYELAELNPDIVEINNKYDHIGIIINQHTEFDHRTGTLVKQTTTNANGDFKISDIPTGKYNLVAIKDSFGFKYIYNVSIGKGSNSLSRDSLYRETYVTSDINVDTTWHIGHHYIIEDDISVNSKLTIEQGTIVRMNDDVKLEINGILNAVGEEDNMIWFTKNDGMTENLSETVLDTNYTWEEIRLTENAQAEVEWCKFDYSYYGLQNRIDRFSISYAIFKNCGNGFKSSSSDSTNCSNLLCRNVDFESEGGISFEIVNTGIIEKNIFYNCYNGLKVKDEFEGTIKNNLFKNNDYGAWLMAFKGEFRNNELYDNEYDIITSGRTSPKITYNEINSNNGILIECDVVYQNSSPLIHNNNFYNEDWFIYVETHNRIDIDATNNYFSGLGNEESIKGKIWDKDENEEVGNVNVSNFRTYKIPDAGITGD